MKKSLITVLALCFLTSLSVIAGTQCNEEEVKGIHSSHKALDELKAKADTDTLPDIQNQSSTDAQDDIHTEHNAVAEKHHGKAHHDKAEVHAVAAKEHAELMETKRKVSTEQAPDDTQPAAPQSDLDRNIQ